MRLESNKEQVSDHSGRRHLILNLRDVKLTKLSGSVEFIELHGPLSRLDIAIHQEILGIQGSRIRQ